ncbi:MAG: class I SAM-dependent methyltransferase [Nanoarchaeota archaeon]
MDEWRKKLDESKWKSSYEENNYDSVFYALIRSIRPKIVVELGTKNGFSAFHMAKALKENGFGEIHCYDLWEEYEFHSCTMAEAEANLKEFVDSGTAKLKLMDAAEVGKNYHDSIDVLHVDLSNKGEILEQIIPQWLPKVKSLIILEGGSEDRDKVDWMVKFDKQPIRDWLKKNSDKFNYIILKNFPGLTLLQPKNAI